eukprot:366474-Chlamydomonas_euryale.AAC.36
MGCDVLPHPTVEKDTDLGTSSRRVDVAGCAGKSLCMPKQAVNVRAHRVHGCRGMSIAPGAPMRL